MKPISIEVGMRSTLEAVRKRDAALRRALTTPPKSTQKSVKEKGGGPKKEKPEK